MKNILFKIGVILFAGGCSISHEETPNVLFIMMDDLGYGHFASHNNNLRVWDLDPFFILTATERIEPPEEVRKNHSMNAIEPYSPERAIEFSRSALPTLSMLAEKGVLFTSAFTSNSLCAPSRLSIATGVFPSYLGAYENLDVENKGLDPGSHLAEKFYDMGYATAHIGKWHIGSRN